MLNISRTIEFFKPAAKISAQLDINGGIIIMRYADMLKSGALKKYKLHNHHIIYSLLLNMVSGHWKLGSVPIGGTMKQLPLIERSAEYTLRKEYCNIVPAYIEDIAKFTASAYDAIEAGDSVAALKYLDVVKTVVRDNTLPIPPKVAKYIKDTDPNITLLIKADRKQAKTVFGGRGVKLYKVVTGYAGSKEKYLKELFAYSGCRKPISRM